MSSNVTHEGPAEPATPEETRREFLYLVTTAVGAMGAAIVAWPLIDSLNPSADVEALSSVDIDLSAVAVGQRITVKWRGNPVFIDRRTAEEISKAKSVDLAELRDPQPDEARVKKPEWLIVVGVCTHLGCVPLGQGPNSDRGDWGGWFCPCHGSYYDTSGRVRRGPAPKNLVVPPYTFLSDTQIRIG
ncbi:MAG: ubiquinol-cytochrome c reductase iron-sulfur subunit [Alphaproteobacteria bacterium]|nr:ubiquinol-cytochrome c reductase iron-sulfur subunit [Alphaproteobacteria bacterium]